MLDFKELTWQDKDVYSRYYSKSPVHYAEYSFLNLYAWRKAYPIEFAVIDENLCLLKSGGPLPGMFGPMGDWSAVKDSDWDEILKNFKPGDLIYDVPEKIKNILEPRENLRFNENRDQHEYVYAVKDLINLKGKAFAHKRNRVRAFLDGYEWDYYEMAPEYFDDVMKFQEQWRVHREENLDGDEIKSLDSEDVAIQNVLEKWNDFNLSGGILKVDEKVIAYTIACELDGKNLDVMFEKAFPEYAGSYQAINFLFQKNQGYKYEFANREEDMGEPGLREAKLSYNPVMMLKKFIMEIL